MKLMLTCVAFVTILIPTVAQVPCGLPGVTTTVSPSIAAPGQIVQITLTNNSNGNIHLPSGCLYGAVHASASCSGPGILALACPAIIVTIPPGQSRTAPWDQRDNNGQQVPSGAYSFRVSYYDSGFTALTNCCPTVMVTSDDTFCDSTDNSLVSCPCGNPGSADAGCDTSQGTGGVRLSVLMQQTAPDNRATLTGTGYPAAAAPMGIVVRSAVLDPSSPVVFGDGLRCVGSPLVRMDTITATGGTSMHTIGHGAGAGSFYYQVWFSSMPSTFCDPFAAFNLSNGVRIVWP